MAIVEPSTVSLKQAGNRTTTGHSTATEPITKEN